MEQILAMRSEVVFRGQVVQIEKQGEWEEAALVLVHHYYKGGGGSFARISGLSTFRLCNGFPSEPGIESVFYARRATDGMLYPIAAIGYEPQGIVGHAPRGLQIGFGIAETTTLGLVTFGSAMALIWMVRPRR
jgi:hypothetical protein